MMIKTGRNELCPCGSGEKFKRCCQDRGAPTHTSTVRSSNCASAPTTITRKLLQTAVQLQAGGEYEAAVNHYRQALAIHPAAPEVLCNLGSALADLKRYDEAIEAYGQALTLRPGLPQAWNNVGLSQQALGRLAEAQESFEAATRSERNFVAAHFNLGRLLFVIGEHADAAESYRRVLALQPNNAQAFNNLGLALEQLNDLEGAVVAYRQATVLDPDLIAAHRGLASTLARLVPLWHVPMMNDAKRNDAYYDALRAAVGPQSRVFEIGTGSGLLAMMAARLGAGSVTTCEAEPLVAATAKDVISANGLSARIVSIAKKSTDLELGVDLQKPADILVSEIFSSELLGEHVLSSIEDAKRRLLTQNCRVIPAAASIMVALFGGDDIGVNLSVENVHGFELGTFNNIVPRRQVIARDDLHLDMLSVDVDAFRFDFEGANDWPAELKELRIRVEEDGRCHGLVQWIRLQMDRDTVFENHPSVKVAASSWTRCVYLLSAPVEVKAGQIAIVRATHNRVCPWFVLDRFE